MPIGADAVTIRPMGRLQIAGVGCAATLLVGLAAAVPAAAADFYVDDDSGSDANACTTKTAPCGSIDAAMDKASAATGSGDSVWVDGGDYDASVVLDDENSLLELDFNGHDGDDQATITAISGYPAVLVPKDELAGRIAGLTLRGNDHFTVELGADVVFAGNELNAITDGRQGISVFGGAPKIIDNVLDASGSGVTRGIDIDAGTAMITGNELRDLTYAIQLQPGGGATANITANLITGLRGSPGLAAGITLNGSTFASIAGNEIRDADPAALTAGVNVQDDGFSSLGTNAELNHNVIRDQDFGLRFADAALSELSGDIITGNGVGLIAASSGIGSGDVRATNATITGNGTDVSIADSGLELDSTIVGDSIVTAGAASCTISHSAGPTSVDGGNGCEEFETTADPEFADPGAGDYHLTAGSPLIDAGNPAPVADEDIDGDDRVLDGDRDGTAVRDIGADEFVPDTTAPVTTITGWPRRRRAKRDRTPTFTFTASEAGATFTCSIDSAAFAPCASPFTTPRLARRRHRLRVLATDAVGNRETTAAERRFKIKRRHRRR